MKKLRKYIVSICLSKKAAKFALGNLLLMLLLNVFLNIKYEVTTRSRSDEYFKLSHQSSVEWLHHLDFSMSEIISIQQLFNEAKWKNASLNNPPVLSAYLEAPNPFWYDKNASIYEVEPRKVVVPLPLREKSSLTQYKYPKIQSCSDIPKFLPVDRGPQTNQNGQKVPFVNVKNNKPLQNPLDEAPYCPVDADPFLPWIHDVFPSRNGDVLHFIAQNKRRCNTGKDFQLEVERLEPQVALMQPVSVSSVKKEYVSTDIKHNAQNLNHLEREERRWRLSTLDEADEDGKYTRFICRFKALTPSNDLLVLDETLSVFPVNYELAHNRKAFNSMWSKKGKDSGFMWLSSFQFDCPVPDLIDVRNAIKNGRNVINNKAILYVDVVPIRTPPRFNEGVHVPKEIGYQTFDAKLHWGISHHIPEVNESGRWENIPICSPFTSTKNESNPRIEPLENNTDSNDDIVESSNKKINYLVGCVWTSTSYKTRNDGVHVSDIEDRLLEWLEFHLLVGFDHIYVYDNSAAQTEGNHSLLSITKQFSHEKVTHIDWPFRVCNNNFPQNENAGERSSQYAAETSCRVRYGPSTEWLANIDPDEYLIPMGNYTDLKQILVDVKKGGTNILSMKSARAFMNIEDTIPFSDGKECGESLSNATCLQKSPNSTYLQTYNCDRVGVPRLNGYTRAKKQIYRPEHVLSHFVHYTVITKPMMDLGKAIKSKYNEPSPSERFSDEVKEIFMLHTKTWRLTETQDWKNRCKVDYKMNKWGSDKCNVGFPFPDIESELMITANSLTVNDKGFKYNAFKNKRIQNYWLPKLIEAMENRRRKISLSTLV